MFRIQNLLQGIFTTFTLRRLIPHRKHITKILILQDQDRVGEYKTIVSMTFNLKVRSLIDK